MEERLIVCGSRGWRDREKIAKHLFDMSPSTIVVCGYDPENRRPRGADRIAYEEAQKLGLAVETHPALWDVYGKGAGHVRNGEMARLGARFCLAFWDGRSTGTLDMMQKACQHSIPVWVVMDKPWLI